MPEFDDKDRALLEKLKAAYFAREGAPQIGDWLQFPDGEYRRIAHVWTDGVQPTVSEHDRGFFLAKSGVSYSGGLDPLIPLERLSLDHGRLYADFWFFHHDTWEAANGVWCGFYVPIWNVVPE